MPSSVPKKGRSLAELFPELAAEADGWDPTTVYARAKEVRAWVCSAGHRWETAVVNRSRNGVPRSCPYCAGTYAIAGENDLATTHPELAAQANGWDPTTVIAGSNKKVSWRCPSGHVWDALIYNRAHNNQGCPFCAGRYAIAGVNDLATVNPELASQADGWDPTTVLPNSHSVMQWRCEFGHKYALRVSERTAGAGCQFCSGRKLLVGFNDLATLFPDVAAQADGWDPRTTRTANGKINRKWKCDEGHSWQATIDNRTRVGSGCPVCSGRDVEVGISDLLTTHPHLAAEAVGWDPTTVKPHSLKKLLWRCTEGHEWKTTVATRTKGKGCPSCAKYGFKPEQEAWMYLVYDDAREVLQLGITNNRDERLAKHRRSGFDQVLDVRGPIDGVLARDLERACLRSIAKRNAKLVKDIDMERFDGWTEAWLKDSLNVTNLRTILDFVYEDEEAS